MPVTRDEVYATALHYNKSVDGFVYYQTQAIANNFGPRFTQPGFAVAHARLHDISGVPVVSGNKAPIFGSGGARWENETNNMPYNLGYNLIFEGDDDDEYTGGTTLPFAFKMSGNSYTNIYTGSNTYFTFGDGSDEYEDLSANNPNIPKIFLGAEDHSYQRVWDKVSAECYRVRYEGTNDTSGSQGDPNIVIEATFCNPALFGGKMVIEILVGTHAATTDINMIASATTQLCNNPPSLEENTSYVMIADSNGEYWTVLKGYFLANGIYAH
jgi:hypothetical protein